MDAPTAPSPGPAAAGRPRAYEVRRSRRKTLAIHVFHRRVEVRCPLRATKREIDEFVGSHGDWIRRRLEEEARRDGEATRIEHGGRIFFRARDLPVELRPDPRRRVGVEGRRFVIQGPGPTAERAAAWLGEHLAEEAARRIPPRARALARHLALDDRLTSIRFRKTRSKWGYCTSDGVLQFNWLVMLAPHSIVDYIIAHEVCHLAHMNHSRSFWSLVASLCPRYREYVGWLKRHEHRLWF